MSKRVINWFRYASPQTFYPLAGKLIPWFWTLAAIFGVLGLTIGFLLAPTDAQQGEGYRIIFLHVPASWMSMFIYLVMAFWAAIGLAFNFRLSGMMASALAPTGALFAFLSLWTGALWGKPMWGTWWVWDARLTSELILLFLYIGFIALQAAIDDPAPRRQGRRDPRAGRRGQHSDHLFFGQVVEHPASGRFGQPDQEPRAWPAMMLWGMLLCALACWMYSIAIALMRVRTIMLERERHTDWVRELLAEEGVGMPGIHWNSLADFLAMGNHGLYVWGSLAVMALLMVAEPMLLLQGRKKLIARLKRQYRAERTEARRKPARPVTRRSND
jgi:heme exporter protein C